MDFMFLNKDDQNVLDFDARAEIVTKDRFFHRKSRTASSPALLAGEQAPFTG